MRRPLGEIQNNLVRMGLELITDSDALVHVTGHPRRDELRQLYSWVKPRIVIPMHGEARHLNAHAALARELGVPEVQVAYNGEMVRIAPGQVRIIDDVPVGRLFRDGKLLIKSTDDTVRERRKLAFVGLVAVALVLSRKGELMAEPIVTLDGVPSEDQDGEPMFERVMIAVEGALKSMPPAKRRDAEVVSEAVRRSVRSTVFDAWGKKTVVKVLLSVVD